jgi:antitoxin (DNA-binding transcriptional repressor) of toxin-antitoxin stability system
MTATKVGIREFRAGLAEYIDADAPIAVTRHGQTVGYFIPTRSDRAAEVAKLKAAGEKLDALLQLEESEVDEMVEEFKQLRRGAKK